MLIKMADEAEKVTCGALSFRNKLHHVVNKTCSRDSNPDHHEADTAAQVMSKEVGSGTEEVYATWWTITHKFVV